MRIAKSTLEKGYCPECKRLLEKIEWHYGAEVIFHSIYDESEGKYQIRNSETEINLSEEHPITEYHCGICQLSYHVDDRHFIANDSE